MFISLLILVLLGLAFLSGVLLNKYVIKIYRKIIRKIKKKKIVSDPIFPVLTADQKKSIESSIKISFTGDLLLLRDMVERSYNVEDDKYEYQKMFKEINWVWKQSDLSIGVLEGPVANPDFGFSTSTYDDGIRLRLNFPRTFTESIKNEGIGIVTLANNHIFDMGLEGQEQTLDVLDEIGLDHVGSYRNKGEHDEVKILNVRGKKIAILAYTYGSEGFTDEMLLSEEMSFRTDYVFKKYWKRSKFYRVTKRHVIDDFKKAKEAKPDVIIVLPHMGGQFLHKPDIEQKSWCKLFAKLGADIVFSDHSHAVQPIEWMKNGKGKRMLVVHCPGNFINSYIEHDGDASMIVEAYLDENNCEPFAFSIVPIVSYCKQDAGQYKAVPLYNSVKDPMIYGELSAFDYKRICSVHKLITKTALGVELPIDNVQERFYSFYDQGYCRNVCSSLQYTDTYKDSKLLCEINNSDKICFVGDSITEGTKNGGYGWFEPITTLFPNKIFCSFSKGAMTSVYFRRCENDIASFNADLYVIAMGCNDIRYRNPSSCAMTAEDFVNNVKSICCTIETKNRNSNIVLISPWESFDPDKYCYTTVKEKERLYSEYSLALEKYSRGSGYVFINPNGYLKDELKKNNYNRDKYYKDHIHPNADQGIRLFSEACILSLKNNGNEECCL